MPKLIEDNSGKLFCKYSGGRLPQSRGTNNPHRGRFAQVYAEYHRYTISFCDTALFNSHKEIANNHIHPTAKAVR